MDPQLWRKIELAYQEAVSAAPDHRDSALEKACGGDQELRRYVEALVAQEGSLLDRPATPPLDHAPADNVATFRPGSQVGPNLIEGPAAPAA